MRRYLFSQTISEAEWVRLVRSQTLAALGHWKLLLLTVPYGLGLFSTLFTLFKTPARGWQEWLFPAVIVAIPLLVWYRLTKAARRQYRSLVAVHGQLDYVVEEHQITIAGTGVSSTTAWSHFQHWRPAGDFLILARSSALGEAIKLAAIPSDALRLIQEKVPKK